MSGIAAGSVLQLPVGAMPAVGFGCWKLGKDIAAETSKYYKYSRQECTVPFQNVKFDKQRADC